MSYEGFSVPEVFSKKNIFITGGTGFVGKVLIEKLLRSCPDIGNIYVLLRSKKGVNHVERLKKIYEISLFDRLKEEQGNAFEKKLIPIEGDVTELGLGISEGDRKLLIDEINFVYHAAATVKFDQPLKEAIIINTRGTRELCKLVLQMKRIEVMVHISTAYCHTQEKNIREEIYPAYADWRKSIKIAEEMDINELQVLAPIYMSGFPNSYTFTKSMGENVVNDMLGGKIPNVIVRPTIVTSTQNDPMPGWIDNFNGPVGILVACGTGLVRISLLTKTVRPDYVSVDALIKSIIVSTWHKLTRSPDEDTSVYNASSEGIVSLSMDDLVTLASTIAWECPLEHCVWYPSTAKTSSKTIYCIYAILFQLIPAVFIDTLLKALNYKPIVVKVQRRIFNASMALNYFTSNDWIIENKKALGAQYVLNDADTKVFAYDTAIDIHNYFRNCIYGVKKCLLYENMDNVERLKTRFTIFYYLDLVVKFLSYYGLFYILYYVLDVTQVFKSMFDYYDAL